MPVARAIEAEAPYFVDYVGQLLASKSIDVRRYSADVHTTLDLHLQRVAQDAVRGGLEKVDDLLSKRRRKVGPAQAALIAIDPRTGEILAMVGGRSYNQSQYNRAMASRRQPGSVFKPFVFLAAFELAQAEGRTDLTPATVVTRRADDVLLRGQGLRADELRAGVRRADHAAARAGEVAQRRDGARSRR